MEDSLIANEENIFLTRKITTLLNDLPERQKEVVYLRFFQDLDRNEIADVMQITPQSVSNFLQKSFTHLRKTGYQQLTLPSWRYSVGFYNILKIIFQKKGICSGAVSNGF